MPGKKRGRTEPEANARSKGTAPARSRSNPEANAAKALQQLAISRPAETDDTTPRARKSLRKKTPSRRARRSSSPQPPRAPSPAQDEFQDPPSGDTGDVGQRSEPVEMPSSLPVAKRARISSKVVDLTIPEKLKVQFPCEPRWLPSAYIRTFRSPPGLPRKIVRSKEVEVEQENGDLNELLLGMDLLAAILGFQKDCHTEVRRCRENTELPGVLGYISTAIHAVVVYSAGRKKEVFSKTLYNDGRYGEVGSPFRPFTEGADIIRDFLKDIKSGKSIAITLFYKLSQDPENVPVAALTPFSQSQHSPGPRTPSRITGEIIVPSSSRSQPKLTKKQTYGITANQFNSLISRLNKDLNRREGGDGTSQQLAYIELSDRWICRLGETCKNYRKGINTFYCFYFGKKEDKHFPLSLDDMTR